MAEQTVRDGENGTDHDPDDAPEPGPFSAASSHDPNSSIVVSG